MPHKGGADGVERARGTAFVRAPEPANPTADAHTYVESFDDDEYRDEDATTARWRNGRVTAPLSSMEYISSCSVGGHLTGAYPRGDLLFVTKSRGFTIVDVSDPKAPFTVGTYSTQENADPNREVRHIAFQDDLAYVADGDGGLEIVDVSDPSDPAFIGAVEIPYTPFVNRVLVSGNVAFLGGTELVAVDVTAPEHATVLAEYPSVTDVKSLFLFGDVLVVVWRNGVTAFDVSDPAHASAVSQVGVSNAITAAYHNGNILVACQNTFSIVDATDPSHLRLLKLYGYYPGSYITIDETEGILYQPWWFGSIGAYDIHDPDEYVFEDDGPYQMGGPQTVAVGEDHLYALFDDGHIAIATKVKADLSQPSIAQSIPVDNGTADVERVWLSTQQLGAIEWYVSADGDHWEPIQPDNTWVTLQQRGADLLFQARLTHAGGVRSTCTQLELHWEGGPSRPRPGPTIVVRPDGSGDVATIRDALLVAEPGDTVLLGPGTYRGIGNRQLKYDRSLPFTLKSMAGAEQTVIDGEGAGSWISLTSDPWAAAPTAESAAPESPVEPAATTPSGASTPALPEEILRCMRAPAGNAAQPLRRATWDVTWTIQGVTVKNFSQYTIFGRDMFVGVSDCIFRDCRYGLEAWDYGGFTVKNSLFEHNFVAINAYGALVEECTIRDNDYGIATSDCTIQRCEIVDNGRGITVGDGGGDIIDSRIVGNGRRDGNGGGIYMWDAGGRITGNLIAGNHASSGGGINGSWATITEFRDNVIVGNTADFSGGALSIDGPVGQYAGVIENNTFVGNSAPDGSLIAVFNDDTPLRFERNIVAFNSGGPILALEEGAPGVTFAGNDIYANEGDAAAPPGVDGNFSADPWFCNRFAGEYTLQDGSTCLPENNPDGVLVGALGRGCAGMQAELDLQPRTLSRSSGGVVTATLHGVAAVDPATVRLNGLVAPAPGAAATTPDTEPTRVPQTALSAASRVSIKFQAQDLVAALKPLVSGETRVIDLTAIAADGTPVHASTEIRIAANDENDPPRQRHVKQGDLLVVGGSNDGSGELDVIRKDGSGTETLDQGSVYRYMHTLVAYEGDILILDGAKRVIRQDIATGAQTIVSSDPLLLKTSEIAASRREGIFFATNENPGHIIRIDPEDGHTDAVFTNTRWMRPYDIVIDSQGRFIVAEFFPSDPAHTGVVRIDPVADTETRLGTFNLPYHLAITDRDEVLVCDRNVGVIYRIDRSDAVSVIASGGLIDSPEAIVVDNDGDYIVVVSENKLVRISADDGSVAPYAQFDFTWARCLAIVNPGPNVRLGKELATPGLSDAVAVISPGIASVTPNPFNPVAAIRFGVVRSGLVDLTVYDVAGRVVERVVHETMAAGEHEVTWEAAGVASGVHFARLTTPDGSYTRKLVVTK